MIKCSSDKTIESLISKFHVTISESPVYICTCCNQLWYKHSVRNVSSLRQSNPDMKRYLCDEIGVNNVEWICTSCHRYLKKNKLPPLAVANGMIFPGKLEFFYLNEVECRSLAPRIAFQKLMQSPREKQFKFHGNVVNVPTDVIDTVRSLPRPLSQAATIKINLKRKLQYKSSVLSLNIRPHKVIQAAVWLVKNSKLYVEGVTINESWTTDLTKKFWKIKIANVRIVICWKLILRTKRKIWKVQAEMNGMKRKERFLQVLLTQC